MRRGRGIFPRMAPMDADDLSGMASGRSDQRRRSVDRRACGGADWPRISMHPDIHRKKS
jgi:hypothetical protein